MSELLECPNKPEVSEDKRSVEATGRTMGTLCNAQAIVSTAYPNSHTPDSFPPYIPDFDYDAASELAQEAQALMDIRHGTGHPYYNFDALHPEVAAHNTRQLYFNNGQHTRTFATAMRIMGDYFKRPRWEMAVHRLVATTHDIDQTGVIAIPQLPRRGQDERASAEWLVEKMSDKNMHAIGALVGAYGTEATQLIVDQDNIIRGQHGSLKPDDYYPGGREQAVWYSAKMSATADTAGLYMPSSPITAGALFKQRYGIGLHDELSEQHFQEFLTFQVGQVAFLKLHEPALPEAEELFGTLRSEVIDEAEILLDLLRSQKITTWRQIAGRARDFAARHSKHELFIAPHLLETLA